MKGFRSFEVLFKVFEGVSVLAACNLPLMQLTLVPLVGLRPYRVEYAPYLPSMNGGGACISKLQTVRVPNIDPSR